MYSQPAFRIESPDEIAAMLAQVGLAVLVTNGPRGMVASHLPLLHDPERNTLVGHLARANPHRAEAGSGDALAILSGPEAYVSPSWYPSKREHGRVVPTWNYEAVHVYGLLTWSDDPERLRDLVRLLTDRMEAGRPSAWSISDAPAGYVEGLLNAIVGVELAIDRIEAVGKLSQNRSRADREGVITGLRASGTSDDQAIATAMSRAHS